MATRELPNAAVESWLAFEPVVARYVRFRALDSYGANVTLAYLRVFSSTRGAAEVTFADRSDGPSPIVARSWDFGDGSPASTERHPRHTFPGPGTYPVTLTVTDATSLQRSTTVDYVVPGPPEPHVVPVVDAGADTTIYAEGTYSPLSTVTSPAPNLLCMWDWGDGSPLETVSSCNDTSTTLPSRRTHTYAVAGTYVARLTVDDGDGGVAVGEAQVTVRGWPTFFQVTRSEVVGSDLEVSGWLRDARTVVGMGSASMTISVDGGPAQALVTNADGWFEVTVPGAAAAVQYTLAYGGTPVWAPAGLTRPVVAPAVDVVFIMDESGSMAPRQVAVRERLMDIVSGLGSRLDFRLGLVGYGQNAANGTARVHTPLTGDMKVFHDQLAGLRDDGSRENGFEGVVLAMDDQMGFRPSTPVCTVLVTDEPATPNIHATYGPQTKADALAALAARRSPFFGITGADNQSTLDYGIPDGLAGQAGGAVWRVSDFEQDATPVLDALIEECVSSALASGVSVTLDGPATVGPDEDVTTTLTVANRGDVALTGVEVVQQIPTEMALSVVSVSHGGTADATAGTVTWPAFGLDVDAAVERTVTWRTPSAATLGVGSHPFTTSAEVRDDGANGPDLNPSDNTDQLEVVVQVAATVPGPPIEVSAVGGLGDAAVTWNAPLSDGGSPLLDYEVESTPAGNPTVVAASNLNAVVGGLANDTDHTFRVRARNAVGWGPWSEPSNVTRTTASPLPDLSVAVNGPATVAPDAPFTTTLTVTNMGNVASTGIVVSQQVPAQVALTVTSISDGGVLNGATGTITWPAFGLGVGADATRTVTWGTPAAASLAIGAHPFTTSVEVGDDGSNGADTNPSDNQHQIGITLQVPPRVPGPPVDVSAVGGQGTALVRWQPPLSDGGSPLLDYEVESTPTGDEARVAADRLNTVVGGLAGGQPHTFRVRARNAVGWGPWSEPSNVTLTTEACPGAPFRDVGPDHPFCPEIRWMGVEGLSTGYGDGTYRPVTPVARQAMAAFTYRLLNPGAGPLPACTTKPFIDVDLTHRFCAEITWMKANNVTSGYADGTFKPTAPVSRQAMAAFLYRLADSPRGADPACTRDEFTDVRVDHPFCGEVDWLVDSGVVSGYGDGSFKPTDAISRQAMAAFVFRYNVLTGFIG